MNNQTKALHIVYFMLLATLISFALVGYQYREKKITPTPLQSILPQPEPIDQIIEAIEKLPDSALKSNLYIIIGTEYAGDGEALNKVLQEWARLQVDQLKKAGKMSL